MGHGSIARPRDLERHKGRQGTAPPRSAFARCGGAGSKPSNALFQRSLPMDQPLLPPCCTSSSASPSGRNAKYGPYSQIRNYLGPYFAVFTVKKAKYTPPNSHLAAPKFAFDVPDSRGGPNHYPSHLEQPPFDPTSVNIRAITTALVP